MDFTCDFNCPVVKDQHITAFCCRYCNPSHKNVITESNQHLWTEKGFLGEEGCKLSRDEMPDECKNYDCRQELFFLCQMQFTVVGWKDSQWRPMAECSLAKVGELSKQSIERLINVMKLQMDIIQDKAHER